MITLQSPRLDVLNNRIWYNDPNTESDYFLEIDNMFVQLYAARQGMNMALDMDYFDFEEPEGHSYQETFARSAIQMNKKNQMKMAG